MTSETVQAAQRLQISGTLVAMGGEVPRLEIECDNGEIVNVANLPATLLSEMPMLLYKRVRLTVEAESQPEPAAAYEKCECGMRDLAECPARFDEPGCGEPAPAAAPDDAERAAYLERWKDAPADATHLAQDSDGVCWFYESEPILDSDQNWFGACALSGAADNLLGSVRCEPRPVQGVGP